MTSLLTRPPHATISAVDQTDPLRSSTTERAWRDEEAGGAGDAAGERMSMRRLSYVVLLLVWSTCVALAYAHRVADSCAGDHPVPATLPLAVR